MNAIGPVEQAIANVEAEAVLLGGLMLANDKIDAIADRLHPEHFFEPLMGRVYSAIVKERSLGRPANPVTLRPYFTDDEAMAELGGVGFLGTLTGTNATTIGLVDLAGQIIGLSKRRQLTERLSEIIAEARDFEQPIDELAAGVETALNEAMDEIEGRTELSGADCIGSALEAIERHDPGVTCHVEAINDAMGPIRRKNLAILAARPGMGKTAVALEYALGAAESGHGVLFVSLEMAAEELGERLVSTMLYNEHTGEGVPYDALVNARVDRHQLKKLVDARERARSLPLHVVDVGSLKIGQLATMVRRWKRRFAAKGQSLDLVVVDYLQLLAPDYRMSGAYEAVTAVSKGLKTIAKANDLGVLALAQLSRKVEERADKRPMLSDLRESGQIEQDADAVLFLLRREYYLRKEEPAAQSNDHIEWEREVSEHLNRVQFICAKRRKGAERTTEGRFYGQYQAVRG